MLRSRNLAPFKLKNDLVGDSDKIFEIAARFFGKPSNKHYRWSDPQKGPITVWEWQTDWWLNITHALGEETINISFRWGNNDYEKDRLNIQSFVGAVKKSWSEWTEDEIISSLEWLMIYSEDNVLTEKMHNAMVMYSYQDPEAVKKYFNNRPLIEDESFQVGPQIQTE
jgi:hypothetical protein